MSANAFQYFTDSCVELLSALGRRSASVGWTDRQPGEASGSSSSRSEEDRMFSEPGVKKRFIYKSELSASCWRLAGRAGPHCQHWQVDLSFRLSRHFMYYDYYSFLHLKVNLYSAASSTFVAESRWKSCFFSVFKVIKYGLLFWVLLTQFRTVYFYKQTFLNCSRKLWLASVIRSAVEYFWMQPSRISFVKNPFSGHWPKFAYVVLNLPISLTYHVWISVCRSKAWRTWRC